MTAKTKPTLNDAVAAVVRRVRHGSGSPERGHPTLKDVAGAAVRAGHTMDFGTLSALERGRRRWNVDHIEAVASALGTPTPTLLRMIAVQLEADGGVTPAELLRRRAREHADEVAQLVERLGEGG